jgi:ubiquinone/menaquinone biosynthesis C-methylase UbiE
MNTPYNKSPEPVMNADFQSAVQAYWESPGTVSIIDKNLHKLEIDAVCNHLLPSDCAADIGCGNGEATVLYAGKVKQITGFERSNTLRALAVEAGKKANSTNLSFKAADILQMSDLKAQFDVVISQRMLINLASWDEQQAALLNIHRMLKPGGRAILIENTNDAAQSLNDMRTRVGIPPIPQHWHNRFFDYDRLSAFFENRFQVLKFYDFGLYYFLTRVYVQMFASFVGYGKNAVKDPIFEDSDRAARILFEQFADKIQFKGCRALGPIQVFVLRREGMDAP